MQKKALLIIDIQNDYFQGGRAELVGAETASNHAQRVLEKCRQLGYPVIHVQHVSTRQGATFFVPETEGVDIHHSVTPTADEKVVIKHYPNSFRETELLDLLQSDAVNHLIVMGMMTHMCVDATTRAAKDYGFDCTVIADACATKDLLLAGKSVDAASVQTAFLAALDYFYADIVDTETFLSSVD